MVTDFSRTGHSHSVCVCVCVRVCVNTIRHRNLLILNAGQVVLNIDPLPKVLWHLDEDRVMKHLEQINAMIQPKEYDPSCHGAEVIFIMFKM
uniref:Uncharacterized protein n=1 Tax=Aegilops tauschii subsp. strangulata TaxID=200361 RepID=A0A453Q5U5_AEGTS